MSLKPKGNNKVYKIRQIQEYEIIAYVEASDWDEAEQKIDWDCYDCFPHDYQCVNHETVSYDILDEYPEEYAEEVLKFDALREKLKKESEGSDDV